MIGRIWFCVSVSAVLVVTQDPFDTLPPLPPEPTTTQQTKPADPTDCQLNAYSPLGFLVKIWNKTAENVTGHGSLISPIAILTSATNHDPNNVTEYEAIGQNIWNTNSWDQACYQVRTINSTILHDKCCDDETRKFFNFLIFVLNDPFKVSTQVQDGQATVPFYPLLLIPTDPILTLRSIIDFDSGNSTHIKCSLPLFTGLKEKKPLIMTKKDQEMDSIAYEKTCVPLMCDEEYRDETNGISREKCEQDYLTKKAGSMMCVEPKDKSRKPSLPHNTNTSSEFYGGAPLMCNGMAFGIVTEVFVREAPKTHPGHFFLVVTFLRVYEWLVRHQHFLINKELTKSIESWNMPPRYLSSEPVPEVYVPPTTTLKTYRARAAVSPTHKRSAALVFMVFAKIGLVLGDSSV